MDGSMDASENRRDIQKIAWGLLPVVITTLVCGFALTAMGLYVFIGGTIQAKLFLGFGVLAGLFSIVAGGAGVGAVNHLRSPEIVAYVVTAVFSGITAGGLLVAIFQASKDFQSYKAGVVGGAMSSFAAIAFGTDLAGSALAFKMLCFNRRMKKMAKITQAPEVLPQSLTNLPPPITGLYTDV